MSNKREALLGPKPPKQQQKNPEHDTVPLSKRPKTSVSAVGSRSCTHRPKTHALTVGQAICVLWETYGGYLRCRISRIRSNAAVLTFDLDYDEGCCADGCSGCRNVDLTLYRWFEDGRPQGEQQAFRVQQLRQRDALHLARDGRRWYAVVAGQYRYLGAVSEKEAQRQFEEFQAQEGGSEEVVEQKHQYTEGARHPQTGAKDRKVSNFNVFQKTWYLLNKSRFTPKEVCVMFC